MPAFAVLTKYEFLLAAVTASHIGLMAQTSASGVVSKPSPPACNLYRIESTPVLSLTQRICLWTDRSLTSGEGLMGAAIAGAYSQLTERSSDRRKGFPGYAERFATRYAQSTAKGLGEVFGGYVNHEGLRRELGPWRSPAGAGFGRRFAHALAAPLWNYEDDDAFRKDRRKRFAFSRVAGALASGFVGMAWAPDRLNTPGRALRRSASAYGGYFSSSLFNEFKGDLMKLFRKM